MIFVTVGTQLPFNRLIAWVDEWAEAHPEQELFVQCGEGGKLPTYAKYSTAMTPDDWDDCFKRADRVVSHAGMGTILKCLDAAKPLLIVPRLASLNEHRNDHQLATAQQLKHISSLTVAEDQETLFSWLEMPNQVLSNTYQENTKLINLCTKLRDYIQRL